MSLFFYVLRPVIGTETEKEKRSSILLLESLTIAKARVNGVSQLFNLQRYLQAQFNYI